MPCQLVQEAGWQRPAVAVRLAGRRCRWCRRGGQVRAGDRAGRPRARPGRRAPQAWARNWRQVSQIIAVPPVRVRAAARGRRPGPCRRGPGLPGRPASTVQAGSWIGASVRTSRVLCRSVWLASMTCWSGRQGGGVAARPGEPVVRRRAGRRPRRRAAPGRRRARRGSRRPAPGRRPGARRARR